MRYSNPNSPNTRNKIILLNYKTFDLKQLLDSTYKL